MKILITENQKKSLKNNLMDIVNKFGFTTAAKAVGTRENLIKILFDGEIKRYLDRVVIELLKDTEIDYEKERIYYPFSYYSTSSSINSLPVSFHSIFPSALFSTYCKNTFRLTEEEVKYVWKEYIEILKDKMENG